MTFTTLPRFGTVCWHKVVNWGEPCPRFRCETPTRSVFQPQIRQFFFFFFKEFSVRTVLTNYKSVTRLWRADRMFQNGAYEQSRERKQNSVAAYSLCSPLSGINICRAAHVNATTEPTDSIGVYIYVSKNTSRRTRQRHEKASIKWHQLTSC